MRSLRCFGILWAAWFGLALSQTVSAANLPDLAPIALIAPDGLVAPPYPTVTITWGVTNQGTAPVTGYKWDAIFLSSKTVLDGTATYLGSFSEYGSPPAGGSYWRTNALQLPLTTSGQYYLIFKTDSNSDVVESNEDNNVAVTPLTYVATPADLAPLQLEFPATVTGPPNPWVTVAWYVVNQGAGPALNTWRDKLYVSTNSVVDYTAQFLGEWQVSGPVEVGGGYWLTNTVRVPVTGSGLYYLIVRADDGDWLWESNPNNNELAMPVTFDIQPPDLAPVALLAPPSVTAPPYPSITVVWAVTNQGVGIAAGFPTWTDQVLFSTNSTPENAVGLGWWTEAGPVAVGGVYWRTNTVQLPVTQTGSGWLFFKADAGNNLVELNETNNLMRVPIAWTITPADLVPITLPIPPVITGPPYPSLTLVWGVTNAGTGAALGSWSDRVLLSADTVPDWQDTVLDSSYNFQPLPAAGSYWHTNTVRRPVVTNSTWYLIFQADIYGNIFESNESNNVVVVPVTFEITPPDLVPLPPASSLVLTSSPLPSLTLTWGVTNQGAGPAVGNWAWNDRIYFSLNPTLDSSDPYLTYETQTGPIPAGGTYGWTNTFSLPVTQSGTYYLLFRANADNWLYESDASNNVAAMAVTCDILNPDLAPISFQVPAAMTSPPNPSVTFVFGVTNQGAGVAGGGWVDQVWLSTNAVPDGTETYLVSLDRQGPLGPAQSYWVTNSIRIPVTASGSWFLIFKTDPLNAVFESNTNNNIAVAPITLTIQPPDLAPLPLLAPPSIIGPPYPSLSIAWGVTNQGVGAAIGYNDWFDSLYISTNSVMDSAAILVTNLAEAGPIAPGTAYWRTNSVRLPVATSGDYFFLFVVDAGARLFESNESNNVSVLPVSLRLQPPDLVASLEAPAAVTAPPNPRVSVSWGVTNIGSGAAIPYTPYGYSFWFTRIYYSRDGTLGPSAALLNSSYGHPPLSPGAGYSGVAWVQVPVTRSETGYLIFMADSDNTIYEADKNNNVAKVQITFNIQPADLAPLGLSAPSQWSGPPEPRLQFAWGVTNQGPGAALPQWTDSLYFSTIPTLDWTATKLCSSYEGGSVAPGGVYWRTNIARVPVTHSGTYYFLFTADDGNLLCESNLVNNLRVAPVTFQIDPPDLAPVLLSAPGSVAGPPNPTVTFSYGITNQGNGAACSSDAWYDRAYISTRPVMDGSEIAVGAGYYGSSWPETGPVAAHHTYWRTRTVTMPVTTTGDYYLLLKANADETLFESSTTNNVLATPISFNVQRPDLAPIVFQAPALASGGPWPEVKLVWGVTNRGAGSIPIGRSWQDAVYLSSNPVIDSSDLLCGSFAEADPLSPGGSYWRTNTVRIPTSQGGACYLIFRAGDAGSVFDSDLSNNVAVAQVTLQVELPDLAPLTLRAPPVLTGPAYPEVNLSWGITNQGSGPARSWINYYDSWYDEIYVSTNSVLDGAAMSVSWVPGPALLEAGGSYWQTNQVHLPISQSGSYYLLLRTDSYGALLESNPSNNVVAVPFNYVMTPPDLAPVALSAPALGAVSPDPVVTLVWGVTNYGPGRADSWYGWNDMVFLSTNSLRDGTETYVAGWHENGVVPPGGSYWRTNPVVLPVGRSGAYYLIFEADVWDELVESNSANNTLSVPINLQINPPDLAALSLLAPSSVTGAPNPTLTLVWGVTNQGAGATSPTARWYDLICLTTNDQAPSEWWTAAISFMQESNSVPAAGAYWRTNDLRVPMVATGTYYLWLAVNQYGQTADANVTNDFLRVPIHFQAEASDLAPIALLASNTVAGTPYPFVTVVVGVTNQGVAPAAGSRGWTDALYLSTTPFLDSWPTPIASWVHTNDVAPGQTYWLTNAVKMPVVDSAGYYLILVTDPGNVLSESNTGNNSLVTTLNFELAPPVDLAATDLVAPAVVDGARDQPVTVAWRVANLGLGPASGSWRDAVYLSYMPNEPWYYQQVQTFRVTNSLAAGAGYWQTNTFSLADVPNGRYYVVVEANSGGEWYETEWWDNRLAAPIQINFSVPGTPRILSGQFLADRSFELAVAGEIGTNYVLQASTNLVNWVDVTVFTCAAPRTYVRDLAAGAFQRRFYRLATVSALSLPALAITSTATNTFVISWPVSAAGWVLETSPALAGTAASWTQVPPQYQTNSTRAWITQPAATGTGFYRLRAP